MDNDGREVIICPTRILQVLRTCSRTRLIAPNDYHIITSIKATLFQQNSGRQGIDKDDCLFTGWCGCHMFC
eukprot:scaffold249341_cov57-Cyclotella_meneghiniana.AAC.2